MFPRVNLSVYAEWLHRIDESRTSAQMKSSELQIPEIYSTLQSMTVAIWIGDETMVFLSLI
jgi:hypothetical protein